MCRGALASWVLVHGLARVGALSRPGRDPPGRPRRSHANWVRGVMGDVFEDVIADDVFAGGAGSGASLMTGWERARAHNACKSPRSGPHITPQPMVDHTARAIYFLSNKAGSSPVRDSMDLNPPGPWPGTLEGHNRNYTRFTFSRDPAARLISAFFYKGMLCSGGEAAGLPRNTSDAARAQVAAWFEEFVSDLAAHAERRNECWDHHMFGMRGRLPDPAEWPMDFIGELASFEEDWAALRERQRETARGTIGRLTKRRRFKATSHEKLLLNVSTVPDHVMVKVCEVYREDYCCLRYPIPKACSIDCQS